MEIFFFPNLQLDLKVPVKFCKQNNTKKGQAWLIPMVLSWNFICIDPRQVILPDRGKTNSLQFVVAISLNPIHIRFRLLQFAHQFKPASFLHVSNWLPFPDFPPQLQSLRASLAWRCMLGGRGMKCKAGVQWTGELKAAGSESPSPSWLSVSF